MIAKISGPPTRERDRITLNLNFYHERIGESPTPHQISFAQLLEGTDQPYSREYKITKEWKSLPIPLEKVGYIIVQNLVGTNYETIPSDAQIATDDKRIVELTSSRDGGFLPNDPGGTQLIPPRGLYVGQMSADWEDVMFRTQEGTAIINLSVYPK